MDGHSWRKPRQNPAYRPTHTPGPSKSHTLGPSKSHTPGPGKYLSESSSQLMVTPRGA